jgi:hypothetical protein
MEYKINCDDNYLGLRNITQEIMDRLKEEGKYICLSVEEYKAINGRLEEDMIKAKREHIKKQRLSRLESAKIIFNS